MKSEIEVSNTVANVIRFLIIEIVVALLIEPAVTVINQIRARRLASSGKPVRIRTALMFSRRDFSGPAVGGKRGVVWKLFLLIGLLAALLAAEFAFDYDVRRVERGSTIRLTGLSTNVTEVPLLPGTDTNFSTTLFNLVKCSALKGNTRHERRLRPDGECYTGSSSGYSFPEPCVLHPVEVDNFKCRRTDEGIVKVEGRALEDPEEREVNSADAQYVFLSETDDAEYKGRRANDGKHIRYCSHIGTRNVNDFYCLEHLKTSGDNLIGLYSFADESRDFAIVDFYHHTQVRIGADTFTEPGCAGCALRMKLIVDFVAANMALGQEFLALRTSLDDYGRVVAMLAMGLPTEVDKAIDDQDTEEVGFLVIDWNFVLPLAGITLVALFILLPSFFITNAVRIPLDYSSAMYCAYDREVGGGACNSKQLKSTYDVGLVETCEKGVLYLSLNAKQTVPHTGEEIRGTGAYCGRLGCERCLENLEGSKGVAESAG